MDELSELGVKAVFKHSTAAEYTARLEAAGLPAAIAKSTCELTSMVGEGVNYLEGPGIINARDVS